MLHRSRETAQPMLKPLPDAPRDHDANASDLVVVTSEGRYLYTNRPLVDGQDHLGPCGDGAGGKPSEPRKQIDHFH